MRIFYVTSGEHVAGGQFVNLEQVAALRRLGYDALFLIARPEAEPLGAFHPRFPAGLEAPYQFHAPDLGPDDIVVVGEMFGLGALRVMNSPARKVIHNQGPYYTFKAFSDMEAIRRWGCEAMILPTGHAARLVERMGWDRGMHVVRPAIDPAFAAATGPRAIRVASVAKRRPDEYRLIQGMFRSLRPDLRDVPWVNIHGVSRAEAARVMAQSEIFLSMGQLEGLGLPPLEAMAAGALVVGFHGEGGREYATPENGDWFDEASHFEIAEALAARIDALKAGERFEARRAAGRRTAAAFSSEAFEAQLAAAWRAIAGPPSYAESRPKAAASS